MKTATKTLLLLSLFISLTQLAACGSEMAKLQAAEKAAEASPTPTPTAVVLGTAAPAAASPGIPGTVTSTTSSSCSATTSSTTVNPITSQAPGLTYVQALAQGAVFIPALHTWPEAMNLAPAGKRMATRGEVILMFDAGVFKPLGSTVPAAWTASNVDATRAWSAATSDGSLAESDKDWALGAVYVNNQ